MHGDSLCWYTLFIQAKKQALFFYSLTSSSCNHRKFHWLFFVVVSRQNLLGEAREADPTLIEFRHSREYVRWPWAWTRRTRLGKCLSHAFQVSFHVKLAWDHHHRSGSSSHLHCTWKVFQYYFTGSEASFPLIVQQHQSCVQNRLNINYTLSQMQLSSCGST